MAVLFFGTCSPGFTAGSRQGEPEEAVFTICTPYQDGESAFLQFLSKARKKVRIAIYGFTDPAITATLIDLYKRGIDVQLLMDKTQAAGHTERDQVAALQSAGVPIIIGKSAVHHQLCHVKFCIVDDEWVEDGSWNYSCSANEQDNILNFVHSTKRAAFFDQYWHHIKQDMLLQQKICQSE